MEQTQEQRIVNHLIEENKKNDRDIIYSSCMDPCLELNSDLTEIVLRENSSVLERRKRKMVYEGRRESKIDERFNSKLCAEEIKKVKLDVWEIIKNVPGATIESVLISSIPLGFLSGLAGGIAHLIGQHEIGNYLLSGLCGGVLGGILLGMYASMSSVGPPGESEPISALANIGDEISWYRKKIKEITQT